ncbi:3',5'-cyclic-nucleotide phosphodiesterase [Oceanospirillum linum]|uniref:3',5'-cyclic-nucleotide phosphodiesterase n=1 Tax=Oceanospirillum linum TaxID=966 RepID=A0A1T1HEG5_OCELI|nr:3',5'-cyclic-nucleotide phosphodiesterase [Oceanospirillum linum]OOV88107.1 3',5'-cyclic-nucleotide phosphodiesterase [Oceanospirillum linum]SEF43365.1 Beta-lactamase superfamily domain-containing protein [Oleiphilus messinensis]SMP01304.1 Beta-lactamase superfamily domain-containing protein [Oceanospirillum linum]
MWISILGCSGGIGPGNRTTSILIDDDILLDAGSGVGDLELQQMSKIRHIFISHSHLDHIAFLPFLVDSIFSQIKTPIQVYGLPETIKALKDHIFNWTIWPDFSELPSKEKPVMQFNEMLPHTSIQIGERKITSIPVEHVVPGVGFCVQNEEGKNFAFSGDTATNDSLWQALNKLSSLDALMIESGYPDSMEDLSKLALHYTPARLADDLKKLKHTPHLLISHLKPGLETEIAEGLHNHLKEYDVTCIKSGDSIQL